MCVYMHVHICVDTCVYMCVCVYVYICMSMCVCMRALSANECINQVSYGHHHYFIVVYTAML